MPCRYMQVSNNSYRTRIANGRTDDGRAPTSIAPTRATAHHVAATTPFRAAATLSLSVARNCHSGYLDLLAAGADGLSELFPVEPVADHAHDLCRLGKLPAHSWFAGDAAGNSQHGGLYAGDYAPFGAHSTGCRPLHRQHRQTLAQPLPRADLYPHADCAGRRLDHLAVAA